MRERLGSGRRLRKCERCGKYKRVLYDVDGMWICSDCIRGIAFYKVFSEGFRDPNLRGDVITVGIDIGNLVWFNPFAQAWLFPITLWMYFKDTGKRFCLEDLKAVWRYRTPLENVLKIYQEEGILKVVEESGRQIIVEGEALREMLRKYGDRPDAYEIIGAWVSGLVISRLHEEAEAPDFRFVNAAIRSIAEKLVDSSGNIKAEPYTKTTGYRCRICGAKFMTKGEVRKHLMIMHRVPSDEVMMHVEEETVTIGYLLELTHLIETLKREGVKQERFFERIEKFAALVHEDPEAPRIVERDGKRYIIIHPAWVRVVARTRVYERELIRGRERLR